MAPQSVRRTLTLGAFSFTHEGTVVRKAKLKSTVPSTAAWEPVAGSTFTAGKDRVPDAKSADNRLTTRHVHQQVATLMKVSTWTHTFSSKLIRAKGSATDIVTRKPQERTTWQPHGLPPPASPTSAQEKKLSEPGARLLVPLVLGML